MKLRYYHVFLLISIFILTGIFIPVSTHTVSSFSSIVHTDIVNTPTNGAEDSSLRILSYGYRNSDPFQEFNDLASYSYLITLVFDSLVHYSFETNEIIPSLARSWLVSLDSRHWTFFLRQDVLFHDGSEFNASAVKFSYDRLIDPSHPAYIDPTHRTLLFQGPLESVTVVDTYIVSFHFSEPYASFLYTDAATMSIYSPRSFIGSNISTPIGTGPYAYAFHQSRENDTLLHLTRNPDYHLGYPPFENVSYRTFNETEQSWFSYEEAIHNREGDLATYPISSLPDTDEYWDLSLSFHGIEVGYFNHSNPYLSNSLVRSAINYGIDKVDFCTTFPNSTIRYSRSSLKSIIHSDIDFHDSTIPGYPFDPQYANFLLDAAGYPRNTDGYRFSLQLSGDDYRWDKLIYIQDQLRDIGINSTIDILDHNDFSTGLFPFDLYIVGWGGLMDPSYVWWFLHSDGDINVGGFHNSTIDQLVLNGQYTPVVQEREYYYKKLQWLVQDAVPYLLLSEGYKPYIRATSVSSLVKMNIIGKFAFNFPTVQDPLFSLSEIPLSVNPLYCPQADIVISPESVIHDSYVNLDFSTDSSQFFPDQIGAGKFYQLSNDDQEPVEYSLRFYYDESDFNESIDPESLALFVWNPVQQSWDELELISVDNDFRYLEVQLTLSTDPLILAFGVRKVFLEEVIRSFKLLFPYLILLGGIISFGAAIILLNRMFLKNLQEEFLSQL